MDGQRFDRWTRVVATATSRRQVLKGIAGGLLAGVFARVAVEEVAAHAPQPLKDPRPLKPPKAFKSLRTCNPERTPCGNACCTEEQTCNEAGTGCIPRGGTECGHGYCVNGDQTCVDDRGCLPRGATVCGEGYCTEEQTCVDHGCVPEGGIPCGTGYCAEDDFCVNGQECVDDCPPERLSGPGTCCPEDQVFFNGQCVDVVTCAAGGDACSGTPTCGPTGANCSCATSTANEPVCRETVSDCSNPTPCNTDTDCGPGGVCVIVGNCCPPPQGFAGICSTLCGPGNAVSV